MRTRTRPWAITLGTLLVALLLAPSPISAHSELRSSTPSTGDTLTRRPASVRLVFDQPIDPTFVEVSLRVGTTPAQRTKVRVRGRTVTATIPPDATRTSSRVQRWSVAYRVVSADGHPITGAIRFSAPARAGSPASSSPPPTPSAPTESPAQPPSTSSTAHSTPNDAGNSSTDGASVSGGYAFASTAVIGGLTAALTIALVVWLSRARRREPEEEE